MKTFKTKKNITLAIFLSVCSLTVYGQFKTTSKLCEGFYPFGFREFMLHTFNPPKETILLPSHAKSYLLKKIRFGAGSTAYAIIFEDSSLGKYVQLDQNQNHSFLDDSLYSSKQLNLQSPEYTEKAFANLPVFTLTGPNGFERKIKLCTTNTGITYPSKKENELYLTAYLYDYRKAPLTIGHDKYNLYMLDDSISKPYQPGDCEFLIAPANTRPSPVSSKNFTFGIRDSFYMNTAILVIDSVSTEGKIIYYSLRDNTKDLKYGVVPGKTVTPQNFLTTSGKTRTLYSTQKDMTLLEFWGTWCNPCMKLTPYTDSLFSKFSPFVQFTGVAFDNNMEAVNAFNTKHRLKWQNFYQSDNDNDIIKKMKVKQYPTFFLITKNGTIIFRETGRDGLKKIAAYLEKKLQL